MNRFYLFADESGDFVFEKKKEGVSRYFIICTLMMRDCAIGNTLLTLKRKRLWEGENLEKGFHAVNDSRGVREQVFTLIKNHACPLHFGTETKSFSGKTGLQIDATIMEKSKAQPHIAQSHDKFYRYGWYYHLKHVLGNLPQEEEEKREFFFITATIGKKRSQTAFTHALNAVVEQIMPHGRWKTAFCPALHDPCLQIADYCAWAIQRKWERADTHFYDAIKPYIKREYDLWSHGKTQYY